MSRTVKKEELIELIEAYSVAKQTENTVLITLAVGAVKQAIDLLYAAEDDFTAPEPVAAPKTVTKKAV